MNEIKSRMSVSHQRLFTKKYPLMVNSGSSALILALNVLNFKKGSEIITPCLNFGTAVSAILISGYKPIFVDIDKTNLSIADNEIEKKITKKTKAIMLINALGNCCDLFKIKKIAKKKTTRTCFVSNDAVHPRS